MNATDLPPVANTGRTLIPAKDVRPGDLIQLAVFGWSYVASVDHDSYPDQVSLQIRSNGYEGSVQLTPGKLIHIRN